MDIPVKEIKRKFKSLEDIKFWMRCHQNNRRNLSDTEKLASITGFKQIIEDRFEEKKANQKIEDKPVRRSDVYAELVGVSNKQSERFCTVINYSDGKIISDMIS